VPDEGPYGPKHVAFIADIIKSLLRLPVIYKYWNIIRLMQPSGAPRYTNGTDTKKQTLFEQPATSNNHADIWRTLQLICQNLDTWK
jgi:hypothetical protein